MTKYCLCCNKSSNYKIATNIPTNMPNCIVPSCKRKNASHRFPKNRILRAKWLKALSLRTGFVPTKFSRVCKFHFVDSDYRVTSNNRIHLKEDAIPSVLYVLDPSAGRNATNDKKAKKMTDADVAKVDNNYRKPTSRKNKILPNGNTMVECRACLKNSDISLGLYDLFRPWYLPWDGMGNTVAADLEKIAKIQILESDEHSKFICHQCFVKLRDACEFIAAIKRNDHILRLRCMHSGTEKWPKPIKLDMGLDTTVMEVDDIKQENVSEPECEDDIENNDNNIPNPEIDPIDIKVEPEEFINPKPFKENANGFLSDEIDPIYIDNKSNNMNMKDNLLDTIKDEPLSETEEITNDLPLECLLCAKVFQKVTGLKAHVIAQHSYKTVRRKTDSNIQEDITEKYICETCNRIFHTSTDLMVHETCHNKHTCYECRNKFDSFLDLTRHRDVCTVIQSKGVNKPKTLDDVRRPQTDSTPEETSPSQPLLRVKTSEELGCMSLHFQIHSVRSVPDQDIKVENGIDSNFSDDSSCNNCYT